MSTVKQMIIGKINSNAWVNNTWLAPYANYIVGLFIFMDGSKKLYLDGRMCDVSGYFNAANGWRYSIEKIITPLNNF